MIRPVNNDNKCFQYAAAALNDEKIGKHSERIKPFIGEHNCEGIRQKIFEKNKLTMLKMRKYILFTFKKIIQSMKNKLFSNDSKRKRMALYCRENTISIIKRNIIKKW